MMFQSENIKTGVVIPTTQFCSKGDEEEKRKRDEKTAQKELNKPCLDNKE